MYIKQILFVLEGLVRTLGGQMRDLVLYFMCVYLVWKLCQYCCFVLSGKVGQNPNIQSCQPGKQTRHIKSNKMSVIVFVLHDSCVALLCIFSKTGSELLTINDFLFRAQCDNINLFKVLQNYT